MATELFRALKIGPGLLRLRRAYEFGLTVEVATLIAKRRYLTSLHMVRPLSAGTGPIDCFMLLNEARFWEGLWSLYSFRQQVGPCRLVVLSDGTLTRQSIALLDRLFPGISVPDAESNDKEVASELTRFGLRRCCLWRQRFVFFRKLVDPFRLARANPIVLLDSDCLHFRAPAEVQEWAAAPSTVRFIGDVKAHSFCVPRDDFIKISGAVPPAHFCAGYLLVPKDAVDLKRVEEYLAHDSFERQLSSGRFSHVAEQTLFAMESSVFGAERLPPRYATCPDIPNDEVTMGHFCGGGFQRTWFYTKGLPLVRYNAATLSRSGRPQ